MRVIDAFLQGTMPTGITCQHLLISGRVQGVGFRASLEARALQLRLAGWVRNRRNGQVEAIVQGPGPAVQELVQWCHQGPPAARVEAVIRSSRPVDPQLSALHCIATA